MEETPEHVSYCPLSLPPEDENNSGAKLAKSVNELNDLAVAIQAFKNRYDELQKHLEFIEQAIDTRTKELRALGYNSTQGTAENGVVQSDSNPKPEEAKAVEKEKEKVKEEEKEKEDELITLCKTMNSRGLRKYVLTRLSETASLREQVPVALRSAAKPSRLVFECIGRFFLQGSKAYTKDSPMIPARQVSVLVLEYYLLSGCVGNEVDLEASLKREVDSAAVAWRKRIFVEGGLLKAAEVDARGLILFIAIFGIPTVFKDEDIYSLVSASNGREFSDALLKSQPLLKRVSGKCNSHSDGYA